MKTTVTIVAALFAFAAVPYVAAEDPTELLEAERWIIGFYDTPEYEVGDLYFGEPVVKVDYDINFIVVETRLPDVIKARATVDESIRYVEFDDPTYGQLHYTPNDTYWNDAGHYGPKITDTDIAWDTTTGSTAITVATIDTGLRKTHSDITGSRVLQGYDFRNNDNDPNDESGCSYHGTHTAGTAGATINNANGIAGMSQHKMLPIKVFTYQGAWWGCTTSTTALVDGLKYAGDQGADVSSNSWGGGSYSQAIDDAITYSHNKGTAHVASAGNSGPCSNCVGQPWASAGDRSIVVSASDSNDNFASFSSEGPQVDVIAPGVDILSTYGSSNTAYAYMSGTSMACPHVAGLMALVLDLNPTFSFSQLESRIKSTATDLGLSANKQGDGRMESDAAVY